VRIVKQDNNGCGVPLLSQARDLGNVSQSWSDCVLELGLFKFRVAIPERAHLVRIPVVFTNGQVTMLANVTDSGWVTGIQFAGADAAARRSRGSHPTTSTPAPSTKRT
jgi:hypothetical protein